MRAYLEAIGAPLAAIEHELEPVAYETAVV
jgi:hypothetical protein